MRCSCHLLVLFVFLCRNAGRSFAEQPEDRRRSWSRKRWVVELNTDIIGTKVIWSKIFYPITVNQMEARESDMSDTLSPSRDRSSDDTSDGNEDEEELNQRQNRVSLHQGKGQRSGSGQRSGQRLNKSVKVNRRSLILEEVNPVCVCLCVEDLHPSPLVSGEPEQIIHHLHRELLEAQDLANNGKHKCLELQGEIRIGLKWRWKHLINSKWIQLNIHWIQICIVM